MIRLAISCDICGAEKKQTNHWFVAYEHSGELRISGWNSRNTKRAGSRHLCGQTCLHKLVDEFMAQTIAGDRASAAAEQEISESAAETHYAAPLDASLTASATYSAPHAAPHAAANEYQFGDEYGSSARLISTPAPVSPARAVPMPPPASASEAPKYVSHQWRSAAWERERARELNSDTVPPRRKGF